MNEKDVKITKPAHAFKVYANSYNVEILNYFKPELQLNDTESAIKNKLRKLLTELEGLKFVTTLVLVFKTIESDDKTKHDTFCLHSKAETIINERDIDDAFESICITFMFDTYKKFKEKVQVGLLIQSEIIILIFQSTIL